MPFAMWKTKARLLFVAYIAAGLLVCAAVVLHVRSLRGEIRQPVALSSVEYTGSASCRSCHPVHHATWYRTFHRTMTQPASPSSVVADFGNASYTYQGITSRFTRDGDRFYIETLGRNGAMQRFPIVLTVGSRRVQQYVTRAGNQHLRLPLAWNITERRWFHLNGGFLHPDGSNFNTHTAVWDANCIFCHNVKPNPRFDTATQQFDSAVAEFGIACEACHGPGGEHVRRNSNPLRRFLVRRDERGDPTIISPRELPKERQVQVCGHCHGQRLPNPLTRIREFVTTGDPYTVGDDLNAYTSPLTIGSKLPRIDVSLRFWRDGTPRLTAYEYQGLLMSADYQKGNLTCIHCHSMHGGDPRGMIEERKRGPQACAPCHAKLVENIAAHTRHDARGSGSDCYACHMPKITYGLLDVHPTHRIQKPDPSRAWRYDMPEACTLCHTNRTAQWAAAETSRMWKLPPPQPPAGAEFETAENIRALLSGDVVQRAIAVMALSDTRSYTEDPRARLWAVPFLLVALEDRYPALRHFADRSLRTLVDQAARSDAALTTSAASIPRFDPLASEKDRQIVVARWRAWWDAFDKSRLKHPGAAVPLGPSFELVDETVRRLRERQRNETITIGE